MVMISFALMNCDLQKKPQQKLKDPGTKNTVQMIHDFIHVQMSMNLPNTIP
jgi:hypothetical protein